MEELDSVIMHIVYVLCCPFQVNLIHVASTCKNAADEKLRQSIRRFADIHGSPAAIILISGDINFAADLNDLRHRYCICKRELYTLWFHAVIV
jgi:hypothetical protein